MAKQNFISSLGIGRKGYSAIELSSHYKSCLLTGHNSEFESILERISRITGENLLHLKIGSERNSLSSLHDLYNQLSQQKFNRIFVIGGGSLIDYAKRLVLIGNDKNLKIQLVVIPSRIGSGAESSMTSIINEQTTKSIEVNEIMMPKTVIYDFDLFDSLKPRDFFEGSIDSLTHLIESSLSFLANPYVDYLSYSTLDYFFNYISRNTIDFSSPSKNFLEHLCMLSFHGGLAQNNAGAGLCHALSHSAEMVLKVKHTEAIAEFLVPTIRLLEAKDSSTFEKFPADLVTKISNYYSSYNQEYGIFQIKECLNGKEDVLSDIIEGAQADPCWKLMKKKLEKADIFGAFQNFYGIKEIN